MDYDKLYGDIKSAPVAPEVEDAPIPMLPDTDDIKELCKAATPAAVRALYGLVLDSKVAAASRIAAATALMDRGYGKPGQTVEHTGKVTHETLVIQRSPVPVLPVIDIDVTKEVK